MWNNGRPDSQRDGSGEGEEAEANSRNASGQTGQSEPYSLVHGHTVNPGTSNFGTFDGYNAFPQSSLPMYSAHPGMDQMHHPLLSITERRQLEHQRQEMQRMEYTRQQLQLVRRQEEVRIARIAEQRRLEEERAARQPDPRTDGVPMDVEEAASVTPHPRGKPESMTMGLMARLGEDDEQHEPEQAFAQEDSKPAATEPSSAADQAPKKKRKTKPTASPRKRASVGVGPSMDDPVQAITESEYRNVDILMKQFCRVPLLAEFSRPVSLLHPELMSVYSKIVAHPVDLGRVCRNVRRRKYKDTRAIRLDMWRIFMNCAIYHTHPSNKDAVPSFVSIALHLREYFNSLWQEYMVPSDPTPALRAVHEKREEDRTKRLSATSATLVSTRSLQRMASSIELFLQRGGVVDSLDSKRIFEEDVGDDDKGDLDAVAGNLREMKRRLEEIAMSEKDYTAEELARDIRSCYMAEDLFENKSSLRVLVGHRVDRLLGQTIVPMYETGCRGVNQSSIWGCMAAAIWARESSKKPYWPGLVLGIIAPDDQKEEWHAVLTERNEQRLPPKLRGELQVGKRKATQALRRQKTTGTEQMSFFLVEFMGTHEFIWVRESDIIENFDPDEDPNVAAAAGNITKKKRSSRTHDVSNSKTFALALEEGRWALDEFEMQLNDACGDLAEEEDEEDGQDMNYSYGVLCQSDEEADEDAELGYDSVGEKLLSASETEEANELLLSDGLLDFTAEGRKNAKKRAAALKKQKASAEKAALKKERTKTAKPSHKSKSTPKKFKSQQEDKKAMRELDRMRKKRSREREKFMKEELRKTQKRRSSIGDGDAGTTHTEALHTRRGRANAIVKGYLMRLTQSEDAKNLGVGNMTTIPSSALDSSGLLGMALAFRAASGQVAFQDSGDQSPKPKPWDAIDVDGPKSSAERTKNLKKQVELLEAEIRRVKEESQERRRLAAVALKDKEEKEGRVLSSEAAAREIVRQRSKKKAKTPAKAKSTQEGSPCGNGNDNTHDAVVEVVVHEDDGQGTAEPVVDGPEDSTILSDAAGYHGLALAKAAE